MNLWQLGELKVDRANTRWQETSQSLGVVTTGSTDPHEPRISRSEGSDTKHYLQEYSTSREHPPKHFLLAVWV